LTNQQGNYLKSLITEPKLAIVMPPKLLLIKPKTGKVELDMPACGQEMSEGGTDFEQIKEVK